MINSHCINFVRKKKFSSAGFRFCYLLVLLPFMLLILPFYVYAAEPVSAQPSQERFRFVVVGDMHTPREGESQHHHRLAAEKIINEINPAFVIQTGDLLSITESTKADQQAIQSQWQTIKQDFIDPIKNAGIPVFYTPGNHDGLVSYYSDISKQMYYSNIELFNPANLGFSISGNYGEYYSFDYGNFHFVSLNAPGTEYLNMFGSGSEWVSWLANDLSSASSSGKQIITFGHTPLSAPVIVVGGQEKVRHGLETSQRFREFFSDYDVKAHFSGHLHVFKEEDVLGIKDFIVGRMGPYSATLRDTGVEEELGFLVFDVVGNELGSPYRIKWSNRFDTSLLPEAPVVSRPVSPGTAPSSVVSAGACPPGTTQLTLAPQAANSNTAPDDQLQDLDSALTSQQTAASSASQSFSADRIICIPQQLLPQTLYDFIINSSAGLTTIIGIARQNIAVGIEKSPLELSSDYSCQPLAADRDYDIGFLKSAYGATRLDVESQLNDVDFIGAQVQVHRKIVPALECVKRKILECDDGADYDFESVESYRWQAPISSPDLLATSSFGIALNINQHNNPNDQRQGISTENLVMDIPRCVIDAFKMYGFKWGGDFETAKCPAHFDFMADPDSLQVYSNSLLLSASGTASADSLICTYCNAGKEILRSINSAFYTQCSSQQGSCCRVPCPPNTVVKDNIDFIGQCTDAMGSGGDCWHDGVQPERSEGSSAAESYCTSACGVAAVKMALKSFNIDKSSRDLFCGGTDSVYSPGGSSPARIVEVSQSVGLQNSRYTQNMAWTDLVFNLRQGRVVAFLLDDHRGAGTPLERAFPSGGHFILLHGVGDDYVIANDPGRRDDSGQNLVLSKNYIERVGKGYSVIG